MEGLEVSTSGSLMGSGQSRDNHPCTPSQHVHGVGGIILLKARMNAGAGAGGWALMILESITIVVVTISERCHNAWSYGITRGESP